MIEGAQVGRDRIESPEIQAELGTENYVTRTSRRKGDAAPVRVELHAAYYTGRVDTVPHVPDRCFVGGGMRMDGPTVNVPLELDTATWMLDTSSDARTLGRDDWRPSRPPSSLGLVLTALDDSVHDPRLVLESRRPVRPSVYIAAGLGRSRAGAVRCNSGVGR